MSSFLVIQRRDMIKARVSTAEYVALYQSLGLCIIPLLASQKEPALKWMQYQSRKPTQQETDGWISRYWANGQQANIGILCGEISLNLVVLDFDDPALYEQFSQKWFEKRGCTIESMTPVVRTGGGGFHVYLRMKQLPTPFHPMGHLRATVPDIQSKGLYVVAPPSIHPNGNRYEFIDPAIKEILEVSSLDDAGIALPKGNGLKKGIGSSDWVTKALAGVSEGERDNTCFKLARHFKKKGLPYEATMVLIGDWAKKCRPPFPRNEAEKCVKSTFGHQKMEMDNQAGTLADAKAVALKHLKLKDTEVIDVILAVVVANKAPGDPVWVFIISPPSSGKTEILRGVFGCDAVHYLGGLTANTFASGFQKKEVGLLKTLPNEITLVIKDFGSVLTMRHEDKAIVLQQLREIYDGAYKKEYGNGEVVEWKGRMGLLAGTTSAIENHYSVIGELGNRYISYRLDCDEDRSAVALKAITEEGLEETMRNEIAEAFKKAIETPVDPSKVSVPDAINVKLASLADLTSRLRSPVSRNPYDKTVSYIPDIEGPSRLAKAFVKLGKGLAAVRGKLEMTDEEYEVIRRIACDSVPRKRITMVRVLKDREWVKPKGISSISGIPTSTVGYEMEDLAMLGVLDRKADVGSGTELNQQTPYQYKLKKEICELLSMTGILDAITRNRK